MASASPPGAPSTPLAGATTTRSASRSGPGSPLAQRLWKLRIPLHIQHADLPPDAPAFVTSVPRFGYLAQLLPKLSLYFKAPCSGFRYEGIDLRSLCAGLLADLYSPELPWRLEVVDEGNWDIRDTFLNSVKEADFVRNGNARLIMGMGVEDTTGLWQAVMDNNYDAYTAIHQKLLHPPNPIKNVPVRLYIPTSPPSQNGEPTTAGSFKVMQSLVPLNSPASRDNMMVRQGGGPKSLGAALKAMAPSLFPSARDPVLANVVMHGAPMPFDAPVEDLMREATYPDGWLNLVVVLL